VLSAGAARSAAPGSFVDATANGHDDSGEDSDDGEQPDQHHEFQFGETAWFWSHKLGKWAKAKVVKLDADEVKKWRLPLNPDEKVLQYKGRDDNYFYSLKKNQELNLVRTEEEHNDWPDEPNPLSIRQRIGGGLYDAYHMIPSAPEGFRIFTKWH